MKTYKVEVHGQWMGHHMIEADSGDEALEKAMDMPVPEHIAYSDYTVDSAEEVEGESQRPSHGSFRDAIEHLRMDAIHLRNGPHDETPARLDAVADWLEAQEG